MNAALLCDDIDELDCEVRFREPVRASVRFQRSSLDRYRTRARFNRQRKTGGSGGAHRRRLNRAAP